MALQPKKMCGLRLSAEDLAQVLHLPDGAEVVAIEAVPGYRGEFRLVVEGAGWETGVGHPIQPSLKPTITSHFDEQRRLLKREVGWGFPRD